MPDEVVTLKVTLDAAKDIESRLRTMDSLMDSLRKNSNVKLTVDTSSFDKLNSEVQKYIASVTEQVNQQLRLASATQEALSAERQLAIESEKTKQAVEKTAQAQINAQSKAITSSKKTAQVQIQSQAKIQAEIEKTNRAQLNTVSALNKTSSAAKEVGSEFGNMFKNMLLSHVINTLISTPITLLQSALDELKAVDTELVNIQKVMGATAGEMENLSEKAYEVGSSLGIAASDYLASVTDRKSVV